MVTDYAAAFRKETKVYFYWLWKLQVNKNVFDTKIILDTEELIQLKINTVENVADFFINPESGKDMRENVTIC